MTKLTELLSTYENRKDVTDTGNYMFKISDLLVDIETELKDKIEEGTQQAWKNDKYGDIKEIEGRIKDLRVTMVQGAWLRKYTEGVKKS